MWFESENFPKGMREGSEITHMLKNTHPYFSRDTVKIEEKLPDVDKTRKIKMHILFFLR